MIHRTPITVRFYELDPYRHLNHSVYIQYFEVGRIDLFSAFGWSLTGMSDLGVHVVVSEITTKFLKPGIEGDELVVETWVEDVKRVTTVFGQRITRGEEVLATQTVVGACTTTDGRPTRFPDELLEGLTGYLAP
ncbi:MAG: acyl-CoA thioesterase [Acidimicrobiia bacterium]